MARDPDARRAQLAKLKRIQLLEIAKEMDIKGRHAMPKARLVSAVLKMEGKRKAAASAPPRKQPLPSAPGPEGSVAEAEQSRQESEGAKYILGPTPPHEEFPLPGEDLPREYGQDRLALMVRDPYWGHAYWEITPETLNLARSELGAEHESSKSILRIYDFESGEPEPQFDIELTGNADNWYINFGKPGGTFCVDIGILTPSGRFYTLARSNTVPMPPMGMSSVIDEKWMSLQEEFERMYALSGGLRVGASSVEMQEMIEKRLREEMASGAISSMMSPAYKKPQRGFWFNVDTELIVYGATEPDATVKVQGRPVQLRPDGTFTLRFALPDGKQTIDLTATSADNKEERTITPEVEKRTCRPEPVLSE